MAGTASSRRIGLADSGDPAGPAAHAALDRDYRRHRRSVFSGIFVGYAAYYLVRNNLALALPDVLAEYPQHSKAELGFALTIARFYRQVDQGKVLIVNNLKAEPKVSFTGAVVLPIIHRAQVMDISLKRVEIDRRGKDGLICADNIRADIKVTFFVRVNKTVEHVLQVAQSIGYESEAAFSRAFKKAFGVAPAGWRRAEAAAQAVAAALPAA